MAETDRDRGVASFEPAITAATAEPFFFACVALESEPRPTSGDSAQVDFFDFVIIRPDDVTIG